MRALWLGLLLGLAAICPAHAQTSVRINADPVPMVDAQINGHPVRLELDLRLNGFLALNQTAAQRLGVHNVPFVAIGVSVEGGASMRGKLARPRVVFGGGASRAMTGIFPAPISSLADGVIGPGALPYDVVTIVLGPDRADAHDVSFAIASGDNWRFDTETGGQTLATSFDIAHPASVFTQTAARRFADTGAVVSNGDLAERPVILGLTTQMQPVRTDLRVASLALGAAFARTNAPLHGELEPDAVVVEAPSAHPHPPGVTLGREALANCVSITVDARTKRLTLRCAP